MKPLVFLYIEGTQTKVVVCSADNGTLSVVKTFTASMTGGSVDSGGGSEEMPDFNLDSVGGDINFDSLEDTDDSGAGGGDDSDIGSISNALSDIKLQKASFIPITTDPSVNYHVYEGEKLDDKGKLTDLIIKDIEKAKGIFVKKDNIDFIELDEKSYLCTFLESSVPSVDVVNQLAGYHSKRYYKIETVKNAEIALANYVSRSTKFFPEDYTLIIHIGFETTKLIFLEGQKLKHIGTTLDIGTQNLHTYDVYFSKILLEMENGGIPRLDNVVLCGDDRSENLVLSFYGTFPEANVVELTYDYFDISALSEEDQESISSYAIPLSGAYEYVNEKEEDIHGINILPKYIQENQRFLQFGWHSYVMLGVLFITTFLMTFFILSNFNEIDKLDNEIARLEEMQKRNEEIINQINPLTSRIANFDNTQAILDSATTGTEIWGRTFEKISNFVERRRNFWVTKFNTVSKREILIEGYSLSRSSLTEFARDNNASILNNVVYDPLREKSAFSYSINLLLVDKPKR